MSIYKSKGYKEYIKRLVHLCITKDSEAWDKFVKLIAPLVYYLIEDKFRKSGFNHRKADIENLKQDILLSIWEKGKLETIRDKQNIIPWICASSYNAASNYIRDLKPVDPPNTEPLPPDDILESNYPAPYEELSNKDMRNDIDSALKSLNRKENLIIKLSLLYGKRYKEISQMLNIPIGTVLVCAKRAKSKLKKRLKKYEPR